MASPGNHPTKDISIEFKIRSKFAVLWFKMCSVDHNEILHKSRQCFCRNKCKILLWSAECITNKKNHYKIFLNLNSIEISVGQAPKAISWKGLWVHNETLVKISVALIVILVSKQLTSFLMPRQLSCRDMCKIVTWFSHQCQIKSKLKFYEIWIMSS